MGALSPTGGHRRTQAGTRHWGQGGRQPGPVRRALSQPAPGTSVPWTGRVACSSPASRVCTGRSRTGPEDTEGSGLRAPARCRARGPLVTVVSVVPSHSPATRMWVQPPRETFWPAGSHRPCRGQLGRRGAAQTAARRGPPAAPASSRPAEGLLPLAFVLFAQLIVGTNRGWGRGAACSLAWHLIPGERSLQNREPG